MTRWPETCGYCGAPMFRGACPRCNYRVPQPGKIVLSGAAIGQTSVGDHYVPRGTLTSNISTAVLANVTIGQGSALFIGVHVLNNDGVPQIPTVTWNGNALTGQGQSTPDSGTNCDLIQIFELFNVTGGTGSVLVTAAGAVSGINAIVTELIKLKSPQSDPGGDHSAGAPAASGTASITLVPSFVNEIQVFYVSSTPGSSPLGSFDATITPGQNVIGSQVLNNQCTFNGSRLSEGLRIGRLGGLSLATKSFGSTVPWGMVAGRLPVDGPP